MNLTNALVPSNPSEAAGLPVGTPKSVELTRVPPLLPSYPPLPQDKHAEEVRKNKELKEEASR